MGFLDLLIAASMPVLKVLLVTALGSVLALDRVDLLGENTRKQVNSIVFYVFDPALVGSSLASTVTFDSILSFWYLPVNIFLTFLIGSALGWILATITKAPRHLKGLILGVCSSGNIGNMLLIIVPAVCKEEVNLFGDPDVCTKYGMAYGSLSMAIGAILTWTYVYNIALVFSVNTRQSVKINDCIIDTKSATEIAGPHLKNLTERLLASEGSSSVDNETLPYYKMEEKVQQVRVSEKIKQHLSKLSRQLNLNAVFAPPTTGAIAGFVIGAITPMRKLIIGSAAPLRVIQDSASMIGDAAVPTMTLIVGANLLRGLKGSRMQPSLIVGIVVTRYIILPLCGLLIVKGTIYFSLVHADPLYQFVLLLQFALPPAMNIGTITQLFGAGETECSVVMLWTYGLASVALTLWSMFFLWIVA